VYREEATFYRAALLLGLIRGDAVVRWSDAILAGDPDAPAAFVEIASTPAEDLSAMRHALYPLCDGRESAVVIRRIIGLVSQDLADARRSFEDSVRVLSQIRRFLKLDATTDDELKTLLVDVWRARHGLGGDWDAAQTRVREWLAENAHSVR
jgi:hypothetical protein